MHCTFTAERQLHFVSGDHQHDYHYRSIPEAAVIEVWTCTEGFRLANDELELPGHLRVVEFRLSKYIEHKLEGLRFQECEEAARRRESHKTHKVHGGESHAVPSHEDTRQVHIVNTRVQESLPEVTVQELSNILRKFN
jgi:hypothetical protein